MNEINSKSVSKATVWSLITEIALKLVSPITNMILARLLMPSAFGLVATITVVISFAEVLTDAGFQKYIIQHEFDSDEIFEKTFRVALTSNVIFSLLVFLMILVFRDAISGLVGSPELNEAIVLASVQILFNSYSSIQVAAYKRDLEFKTLFKFRILFAVLPFITTIPLAYCLKSFWSLIIGGLFYSFAQFVVFLIKPKVLFKFVISFSIFKKMFSFTFWTLLESIIIWLTTNIDIFIVGRVLNEYYLGLYKTSMSTVDGYMRIISAAIIPVLFSTLSRYQNDEYNFQKTFFKFQKMVSIFLIPMGMGLFLFRNLATTILLGRKWLEAADFIGVYSIAASFRTFICNFASEVFRSKGQPKVSMAFQCVFLVVFIPSIVVSSEFGFKILYIVRSMSSLLFIILALSFLQLLYKIHVSDIVKNILPQTVSSLAMFIFALILKRYFQSAFLQFVLIFICIIVYFCILGMFKSTRKMITELSLLEKLKHKGVSDGYNR